MSDCQLRKISCRCVLDDDVKSGVKVKSRPIECFNRYELLTQMVYSNEAVSSSLNSDAQNDTINVDVDLVGNKAKALILVRNNQKKIEELLVEYNLDVVGGLESW